MKVYEISFFCYNRLLVELKFDFKCIFFYLSTVKDVNYSLKLIILNELNFMLHTYIIFSHFCLLSILLQCCKKENCLKNC